MKKLHQKVRHLLGCFRFLCGPLLGSLGPDHPRGGQGEPGNKRRRHGSGGRHPHSVPLHELTHAVAGGWRPGQYRLVPQVPLQLQRHSVRRVVAPGPVLLHRLQDDPVQVGLELLLQRVGRGAPMLGDGLLCVPQARQPRAGPWDLRLPDRVTDRLVRLCPQIEGQRPHQQLIQHHPQRVHVRAGVHIQPRHLRLLGAHVLRGADDLTHPGHQRPLRQLMPQRLGDAEVDDLHYRLLVLHRHQHVCGLQVPVDDPLMMGVLDGLTDIDEEADALVRGEAVGVAVVRDRDALHQLHDEEGATALGRPPVVEAGDVGVVHHRQGLALRLQAGQHLFGVHPQLDDLERYAPVHGLGLLGEPHLPHPPFAQELQQLVRSDPAWTILRIRGWVGHARMPPSVGGQSLCLKGGLHRQALHRLLCRYDD